MQSQQDQECVNANGSKLESAGTVYLYFGEELRYLLQGKHVTVPEHWVIRRACCVL